MRHQQTDDYIYKLTINHLHFINSFPGEWYHQHRWKLIPWRNVGTSPLTRLPPLRTETFAPQIHHTTLPFPRLKRYNERSIQTTDAKMRIYRPRPHLWPYPLQTPS